MPDQVVVDYEVVKQVRRRLSLIDIGLNEVRFDNRFPIPRLRPEGRLRADCSDPTVDWGRRAGGLLGFYSFTVWGGVHGGDADADEHDAVLSDDVRKLFEADVSIRVEYALIGDQSLDEFGDDAIVQFFVASPRLQVMPYLRVVVQDLTNRAGWPPLLLPLSDPPSEFDPAQYTRIDGL